MPRKPKQERAVATVNAIVEATARCIAEHGAANTSTHRIAKKASVSVGTVYEYFKNKEEIFDALNQRFVGDVSAMLRSQIPNLATQDVESVVAQLVLNIGEILQANGNLYLDGVPQILQMDMQSYAATVNAELKDLVLQFVIHNPEYVQIKDIPAVAYVFINASIYSILSYFADPSPPISFEELAKRLAKMISHYLKQELVDLETEEV